jgi:hypothetical protein
MSKTYAAVLCVWLGAVTGGCKSEQSERNKQAEAAQAQLELARQQAALAQAQLAKAEQQMAESAAKLGTDSAAVGAQGAALGMQAAAAGIQAASAAMNGVATTMGGAGGKAALVDFRALKTLLPASVGGLKRVSATGEKNSVMGLGASQAEGKYEGSDGAWLKVKIMDAPTIGGLTALGFQLAAAEIDNETEDGYERTTTLSGNKAIEKYEGKAQRGEVKMMVANRFVVEIEGQGVPMEVIKEAVGKVDLARLQALGVSAAAAAGAAKK